MFVWHVECNQYWTDYRIVSCNLHVSHIFPWMLTVCNIYKHLMWTNCVVVMHCRCQTRPVLRSCLITCPLTLNNFLQRFVTFINFIVGLCHLIFSLCLSRLYLALPSRVVVSEFSRFIWCEKTRLIRLLCGWKIWCMCFDTVHETDYGQNCCSNCHSSSEFSLCGWHSGWSVLEACIIWCEVLFCCWV